MGINFRRRISLPFLILLLFITLAASCNDDVEEPAIVETETEDTEIPITTSSGEARAYFNDARESLFNELAWLEAREEFKKAINADTTFALAYLYHAFISDTATRRRDLELAVKHSDKASKGEKMLIEAFQSGIHDTASISQVKLNRLAEMYPEDKYLLWMIGNNYFLKGEDDKAIEAFTRALEIDKDFGGGYNMIGYAYLRKRQFDSASRAFDKYIELYPNVANPYDSKADYYRAVKDYEQAIAHYNKAVSIDSSFYYYSGKKARALEDSLRRK